MHFIFEALKCQEPFQSDLMYDIFYYRSLYCNESTINVHCDGNVIMLLQKSRIKCPLVCKACYIFVDA